jgi:serine-type D-Ala-D-Ala carboxypeptidase
MLFPLLIAAFQVVEPDTLLVPGVVLLGDEITTPTYLREEPLVPSRLSFAQYVTLPLPAEGIPGSPVHSLSVANEVGYTKTQLDNTLAVLNEELSRGAFPGAAIAIGRWNRTVVERGIGTADRGPFSPRVDPDYTLYDLASLTKVIATTTAVMLLVEDGVMELDAPVWRYLPQFSGGDKDYVTVRHLLTHNSGLPAWVETYAPTPDQSLQRAIAAPLTAPPGQKVEYSDIGFVVLWAAAEAAYGGSIADLLDRRVFDPLEMWFTGYLPGEDCIRCAPTEVLPGFRGVVHDPIARRLGGVTGNAGLFSTAHDLGRFAAMLANGGELGGVRVLQRSTIELFTQRQFGAGTRALGWDTPDERGEGAGGLRISSNAFGHTGFTGTSLWVDPDRGTWVVLLSNRTFQPSGPNRMQALRREINDVVATAVDLTGDFARDR